ncbi:TIGR02466 family protein [Reinekea blandensis]|uniref:Prolyl 4-hydroxylase alpha subunit Fe(2+) 2OG dioxygenase domain-containing protein n=1 Tax=Reinekea blandensis MED297 TaxID=314283 RepID=A4BG16_9GAMM|nr:TIGR02466 family protein [Reinekea blandensis]EAR09034.1 hypothetical protein MED297_04057 [Reinekea sp. MED297] [Reinekea blandensis MED297]
MTQTPTVYSDAPEIDAIDTWSTPLFVASQPYHELLKEPLLTAIYADAEQAGFGVNSQVAEAAKGGLAESDLGFLERDQPDIQTLKHFLEELILTVASDVNEAHWPGDAEAQAEIIESWYHITRQGGFHDAHSHPNCSWCGIYYLEPGDSDFHSRSGLNRFYDPRVNAEHYQDAGTAYLNAHGVYDMEPKEGQVILFPSYLKHSALPYFGQQDRIVIAFNAQVHLHV